METKEELVAALKEQSNNIVEQVKGMGFVEKTELKQLQDEVNEGFQKLKSNSQFEVKATLENEIKENKEKLALISKGSNEEMELKATVNRASIATNVHQLEIDGIGQLQRKARSLYDKIRKIPVSPGNHKGTIAYTDWDEATVVKAAAMVAEGAAFPESTSAFKGYTLQLRKIGDTLPVTDEFFEDEQMAAAELNLFLDANVNSKIDDQIVNGDNTGENLKGIVTTIPAFTAVASGITDANISDLIVKTAESITSVGGAKYRPDFVAMNIADINKLMLKKTTYNSYVFDRADDRLSGIEIVEDNNVAANTLFLGDSRFIRIYEMGGVTISRGLVNAQFTSDMSTIKVRKRMALLIREADKTGFRKVASISASLVTLAT